MIHRDELTTLADSGRRAIVLTLTREASSAWTGRRGRIDGELLAEVGWPSPRSTPLLRVERSLFEDYAGMSSYSITPAT